MIYCRFFNLEFFNFRLSTKILTSISVTARVPLLILLEKELYPLQELVIFLQVLLFARIRPRKGPADANTAVLLQMYNIKNKTH